MLLSSRCKVLLSTRGQVLLSTRGQVLFSTRSKVLLSIRCKVLLSTRGQVFLSTRGKVLLFTRVKVLFTLYYRYCFLRHDKLAERSGLLLPLPPVTRVRYKLGASREISCIFPLNVEYFGVSLGIKLYPHVLHFSEV